MPLLINIAEPIFETDDDRSYFLTILRARKTDNESLVADD